MAPGHGLSWCWVRASRVGGLGTGLADIGEAGTLAPLGRLGRPAVRAGEGSPQLMVMRGLMGMDKCYLNTRACCKISDTLIRCFLIGQKGKKRRDRKH